MQEFRQTILGLNIGGTKTAVVEGTRNAQILQRLEFATGAARPFDECFPTLLAAMREVMAAAVAQGRKILALSVSIGGPLRIAAGELIDPPHLPGWHGIPLKMRLQQASPTLPVFVEHDGNAGALAEFHFGVGRNHASLRDMIFLTFGTGLGRQVDGARRGVAGRYAQPTNDRAGFIGRSARRAHSCPGPTGAGRRSLATSRCPTRSSCIGQKHRRCRGLDGGLER